MTPHPAGTDRRQTTRSDGLAAPAGPGLLRLAALLFALAAAAGPLAAAAADGEPGTAAGAAAQVRPMPVPMPVAVADNASPGAEAQPGPAAAPPEAAGAAALAERVRGLEDKLRESAAARKAADQARMAAERRQAEAVQEALRVTAGMAELAAARADLERRLAIIEEAAARTAGELGAARAQLQTLGAESEAGVRRETELRVQIAQLDAESRAREAEAARLAEEAARTQAELRTRLLTQETESARLAAEHATMRAERDDFAERVRPLAEQLPKTQGGTLTGAEAERRSAAAADALREAIARAKDSGDSASREAVQKAEETLRRCQFATALVTGAQGLYRVRPADSLPQIAGRVYGNTSRWRTIRDANRQVLPDQGRPTPGLTLVIP